MGSSDVGQPANISQLSTVHGTPRSGRVFSDAKAECGYLRNGSHWSEPRAVRAVRAEQQPELRDIADLGCRAAWR